MHARNKQAFFSALPSGRLYLRGPLDLPEICQLNVASVLAIVGPKQIEAVEVGIGELHALPQVCIYGTRWHWLRHEASHVANSLEVHRLLLPLCMKVVPNKALHILSAHMCSESKDALLVHHPIFTLGRNIFRCRCPG